MTDDDWKQIHESAEQERETELRKRDPDFHGQPHPATLKLATRICFAGLVPPLIIVAAWKFATVEQYGALTKRMVIFICATAGFALMYAPLGAACGFLAHRLCRASSIPERRMAVALALLVDVTVFGWLLCLLLLRI